MREQYLARSSGDFAAHSGNAARAAWAALSRSSAVPLGMVAMTEPSVESNTSMVSLPVDDTHAPSM